MFRIVTGNAVQICGEEGLYDTSEFGLFYNFTLINHACVPNATDSWVMGDFRRRQVRAFMVIEKGEEIVICHRNNEEFLCRSRELRRQQLLWTFGFLCKCSECSLEGEDLEDNERMRTEIREKQEEVGKLMACEGSDQKRSLKKAMKLAQLVTNLTQKLNIRAAVVPKMIEFYHIAFEARRMGIPCKNEPDIYKQEAFKYAKMFGDFYLHYYNKHVYV